MQITCQIQFASVYAVFCSVWGINVGQSIDQSVWGINGVSMLDRETIDQGEKCYLSAITVEMISK